MITVSTSHAPAANYFTREGGYFEKDAAGLWWGGLARHLHLEGEHVRKHDFECLRFGLAPDGTPLLQNAGKRTLDGRGLPHPLTQITCNAPKDVAFLAAMFPERRTEILKAHTDAVLAVARYVEEHLAFVRFGKAGKHVTRAEICAALFLHLVARDGSPHVHTHIVVMPAALASDQKTRRIAERVLFRAQKALSALYDAELSKNLRAMGLRTVPLEVGFRVEGVPDEARRLLSPRRTEILAELSARGLSGAKHAERVTKLTRRYHPKRDWSPEQVFGNACALLERAGFTRERCHDAIFGAPSRATNPRPDTETILQRATAKLPTDRAFTETEVTYQVAKEGSRFGLGIVETVSLAAQWLASSAASLIAEHRTRRLYVHSSVYQAIESALSHLLNTETSPASSRTIRRLSSDLSLSESTREVIPSLLGPGPRVRVLLAQPGPEKDQLLSAIAALPLSTLGLGLTTAQRDRMKELGFERTFTLERAIREYNLTGWNWKPFRDAPHRLPFEKVESSPLQDELAASFGFLSRAEQRYRAFQRSREGLDLRGTEERIIVIDDAAWVDPARLSRVLKEVERGRHNTLLLVADPREGFFTPACRHLEAVQLVTAHAREEELRREHLLELSRSL